MRDRFDREINYMRISVTDRCNFRCRYCMPPEGAVLMRQESILCFEEILRIAEAAVGLGIRRFRVTGGELFVRRGVMEFLEALIRLPGVESVSLTTNGSLLEERLPALKRMGVQGINVSLDTMDREQFLEITGRDELETVLRAIKSAAALGFERVKVNCVPMRGVNEDQLCRVAGLARELPVDVRFIELMPIGLGRGMEPVPQAEVAHRLEQEYGPLEPERADRKRGDGPAVYGRLPGFLGGIGFISALSHEFCGSCSRIRLLADGGLKGCLNWQSSANLRDLIRGGCSREELAGAMRQVIWNKPRRHAFEYAAADTNAMFSIGG